MKLLQDYSPWWCRDARHLRWFLRVVVEARAILALLRVPPCWGPASPFKRLEYIDDTTRCIDSESDLPVFANNLQKAGLHTNLFSPGPKLFVVEA